jgi:hypothetical protein
VTDPPPALDGAEFILAAAATQGVGHCFMVPGGLDDVPIEKGFPVPPATPSR